MKMCAPDCVAFCANCAHWKPDDRWGTKGHPTEDAFCEIKNDATNTDFKCDEFVCVHAGDEDN